MKKRYLIVFFILTLIVEITLAIVFFNKNSEIKNDTVKINELVREVEDNYGDTAKYPTYYEFTIIDNNGDIIYKHGDSASSLNEAYKNSDTIIDIKNGSDVIAKIIIKNSFNQSLKGTRQAFLIAIISISVVQLLAFSLYFLYLYKSTIKPFKNMKKFAERVAGGNLDIPLTMDRGNNFGAFTESFDIMRSELKKAKLAEAEAEKSKRELVARLSHDIKTPVASIMSVSELGEATASDEKSKEKFNSINQKGEQINALVNNLFTITIEELDELSVNPTNIASFVVKELIKNSDYLNKANSFDIPECNLFFDRLRLQQVFDNIFANSYKYANTNIEVKANIDNEYLVISIKDFGDTIKDEEIPLLLEKYNRGSNTENKDGAGLGLYITSRFLEAMNGNIEIRNDHPGFKVLVYLRII